ncbi:MAG: hypothetical protein E5Y74_00660 [Mesorhizobium sp.]|nr:MAG: hypothetical protein E5Y74_00660 [Mesorhizobium sp.]
MAIDGDTKTCPDCAEPVQRNARICRHCRYEFADAGAPGMAPARDRRPISKWFILPALAVLVWVGLHKGEKQAGPVALADASICNGFNAQEVLDQAREAGIIRDIRRRNGDGAIADAAFVEVVTARWALVGTKIHVGIAMAAYCQVAAADGTGVAMVKGSLEEDLGSVVNGNWMR